MSNPSEPAARTTQGRPINSAALLLLAVAIIVGGVIYGVWQNRSVAELKDAIANAQTTIQNVNASLDKLRTENSANLNKLREENSATLAVMRAENSVGLDKLRADNADLRSRLAAAEARGATTEAALAKTQQRDPDAIYQAGAIVGRVTGAHEDRAASIVTFEIDRRRQLRPRKGIRLSRSHAGGEKPQERADVLDQPWRADGTARRRGDHRQNARRSITEQAVGRMKRSEIRQAHPAFNFLALRKSALIRVCQPSPVAR